MKIKIETTLDLTPTEVKALKKLMVERGYPWGTDFRSWISGYYLTFGDNYVRQKIMQYEEV